MHSFTDSVVLQKTFDEDVKAARRPLDSCASVSVESDRLDVSCSDKYLNDSVYSCEPQQSFRRFVDGLRI